MEPELQMNPLARAVMQIATLEAAHLYHDFLGTEHVLLALTRAADGSTARLLAYLGQDAHQFRGMLRARSWPGAARYQSGLPPRPSPRLRQTLTLAQAAAGEASIGERALLLGILRAGPGVAVRALEGTGQDIARLIEMVAEDTGPEAKQIADSVAAPPPLAPFAAAPAMRGARIGRAHV